MKGVFSAARNRPWARKIFKFCFWTGVFILFVVGMALVVLHIEDTSYTAFRQAGVEINRTLKALGQSLPDAVKSQNIDDLLAYYANDYKSPGRGRWEFAKPREINGIHYETLEKSDEADIGREGVAAFWRNYVAGLSSVEHVECKMNLTEAIEPGKSARVTVKFIVDGVDRGQHVIEDRFFIRCWLRMTGPAKGWVIVREELLRDPDVSNVRVAGSANGFKKLDLSSAGIDYVHRRDPNLDPTQPGVKLKFAVMEHAFGGLAAADYDDDGWPDLLFCDGVETRLYRNLGAPADGGCRFADVTEEAGLKGIGQATCAVFVDLRNSGRKDLFIGRYKAPSKFFMNNGDGTFTDRSREIGLDFVDTCSSVTSLDYDRDGFVDLFITNYGDAEKEVPRIPFFARNGRVSRLYHNIEGKRFEDVTEKAGIRETGWGLAVCVGDINGDSWPDIGVANDFGRKHIYRNNGNGTFTECAKELGTLDFSGGMGIAMGDVYGHGLADIYTSNIYSNQRWLGEDQALKHYMRNTLRSKWLLRDFGEFWDLYWLMDGNWRAAGRNAGEGNSLYRNNGDGTFRKMRESCTNRAGWGWGIALFDATNSGNLDIYAANGWISGKNKDDL